jgi:hypothetical protein
MLYTQPPPLFWKYDHWSVCDFTVKADKTINAVMMIDDAIFIVFIVLNPFLFYC